MKYKALGLLSIALCCASFSVQAADFKLGYVKIERVYAESAPALQAQKKLEKEFAPREAELKRLATKLKDLQAQLQKATTDAMRKALERDFASADREYQTKLRDYREDLNQRRSEEFALVQERANKVVKALAEKEQFDLILQDAVYVNAKFDITARVLKELEKN